jgi:hypothetical protein
LAKGRREPPLGNDRFGRLTHSEDSNTHIGTSMAHGKMPHRFRHPPIFSHPRLDDGPRGLPPLKFSPVPP